MERMKVLFEGRVQGVGFRFSVVELSKPFDVKGTVKNLPSGQVELIAESEKETLESFLSCIQESRLNYFISETKVCWSPATNEFNEFKIAY